MGLNIKMHNYSHEKVRQAYNFIYHNSNCNYRCLSNYYLYLVDKYMMLNHGQRSFSIAFLLKDNILQIKENVLDGNAFYFIEHSKDKWDMFSECDVEALLFVLHNIDIKDVVKYTNKYLEISGNSNCIIGVREMFSTFDGDILAKDLDSEDIETCREMMFNP